MLSASAHFELLLSDNAHFEFEQIYNQAWSGEELPFKKQFLINDKSKDEFAYCEAKGLGEHKP